MLYPEGTCNKLSADGHIRGGIPAFSAGGDNTFQAACKKGSYIPAGSLPVGTPPERAQLTA